MNFVPLVVALVAVLLYIAALKLIGPPPNAQTATMLNVLVGLIVLGLVLAAVWPLLASVSKTG